MVLVGALQMSLVAVDGLHEFGQTTPLCSDRAHDRHAPLGMLGREALHVFEVFDGAIRAVSIGFVDHEHVGYFENPCLDRLDVIAQSGNHHHDGGLGRPDDVDLVLSHAHRFDQNDVEPHGVQDNDYIVRGARQSAQLTACRHGSDEYVGIDGMIHHADSVTKNGASAEGRRWVDRHDAHALVEFSVLGDELIHQGRLPRSWIAGDANDLRSARFWVERSQRVMSAWSAIIEQAHQLGSRSDVPVFDPLDQGLYPCRRIRFGIGLGHRRSIGSVVGAVNDALRA